MPDEPNKIIVDSDWKVEAQKEKERLAEEQAVHAENLPDPHFQEIISMIAMQAIVGLGGMKMPDGRQIDADLRLAKHHIDLLEVLQTKTKGNLEETEAAVLDNTLHELRMSFVHEAAPVHSHLVTRVSRRLSPGLCLIMFIPIRTDTRVKHPPLANYLLLAANILVFAVLDIAAPASLLRVKLQVLALNANMPQWWQFFTYQFLHGDLWHLGGNMLFLWVFGNSVNVRFGNVPYLCFYLAGGVFAAWGFCLGSNDLLLGASASIAAVTTSFVVLFPKSRILFLSLFFIITTFELPGLWIILLKIVVWDNVLAPALSHGPSPVAYSAHLYGYFYGLVITSGMLMARALPRDQFDLPALIKRWYRRKTYSSMMSDPQQQARAQYGTVARPITVSPEKRREMEARQDQIVDLRSKIYEALNATGGVPRAVDYYEQLMQVDPRQCLSRQHQLDMSKHFYRMGKFPQAAAGLEKYVAAYPQGPENHEARLLLGIIYARELEQYEAAEGHLQQALQQLTDPERKEQCQRWLEQVVQVLHPGQPQTE